MENKAWKAIVEFYRTTFGIQKRYVDIMPDIDIIKLAASGLSNTSIQTETGIDVDQIKNILITRCGFDGWMNDLCINPLFVYKTSKGDKRVFCSQVDVLSTRGPFVSFAVDMMFKLCRTYTTMDKLLERKWK
jgi:hypothetical protein